MAQRHLPRPLFSFAQSHVDTLAADFSLLRLTGCHPIVISPQALQPLVAQMSCANKKRQENILTDCPCTHSSLT